MDLTPIHRTSYSLGPVVVQHQVRVPLLAEPALNLVLRLPDRRADYMLGRRAICVRRRPRDIFLSPKAPSKVLLALADMLAKNMPAGLFVLTEVAARPLEQTGLVFQSLRGDVWRSGACAIRRGRRLA